MPVIKKYYKTAELVKVCLNDSQTVIGFGVDLHNNENVKYMFRAIGSGITFSERFEGKRVKNVVFFDDNSIVYVTEDSAKRPSKVFWKELGKEESTLLYEEASPEHYLDIHTSKDKLYVFITASTKTHNEVHFLRRKSQPLQVEKLFCRSLKARCSVNSSNGSFYLMTDTDNSHDYKVVKLGSDNKR